MVFVTHSKLGYPRAVLSLEQDVTVFFSYEVLGVRLAHSVYTLVIDTANQSQTTAAAVATVSVAGVQLPVADQMKVLGVVLDRRLTFDKHASAVAPSCIYHARAIRHIRHLISTDLAPHTLACSLILSRVDYCNALLHGAPASSIQKLERVQSIAARIVLQATRRSDLTLLLRQLHWLPVRQRITYK